MSPEERDRRSRFRNFMDVYYFSRYAWELECESATGGYPEEVATYKEEHGQVLFKTYLEQSRGMPR